MTIRMYSDHIAEMYRRVYGVPTMIESIPAPTRFALHPKIVRFFRFVSLWVVRCR